MAAPPTQMLLKDLGFDRPALKTLLTETINNAYTMIIIKLTEYNYAMNKIPLPTTLTIPAILENFKVLKDNPISDTNNIVQLFESAKNEYEKLKSKYETAISNLTPLIEQYTNYAEKLPDYVMNTIQSQAAQAIDDLNTEALQDIIQRQIQFISEYLKKQIEENKKLLTQETQQFIDEIIKVNKINIISADVHTLDKLNNTIKQKMTQTTYENDQNLVTKCIIVLYVFMYHFAISITTEDDNDILLIKEYNKINTDVIKKIPIGNALDTLYQRVLAQSSDTLHLSKTKDDILQALNNMLNINEYNINLLVKHFMPSVLLYIYPFNLIENTIPQSGSFMWQRPDGIDIYRTAMDYITSNYEFYTQNILDRQNTTVLYQHIVYHWEQHETQLQNTLNDMNQVEASGIMHTAIHLLHTMYKMTCFQHNNKKYTNLITYENDDDIDDIVKDGLLLLRGMTYDLQYGYPVPKLRIISEAAESLVGVIGLIQQQINEKSYSILQPIFTKCCNIVASLYNIINWLDAYGYNVETICTLNEKRHNDNITIIENIQNLSDYDDEKQQLESKIQLLEQQLSAATLDNTVPSVLTTTEESSIDKDTKNIYEQRNRELQRELQSVKQQKDEKDKTLLTNAATITELQLAKSAAEEKIAQLQARITELEKNNTVISEQQSTINKHNIEKVRWESKIENYESQLQAVKDKNKQLDKQLSDKLTKLGIEEVLKQTNTTLNEENDKLNKELTRLKKEFKEVQSENNKYVQSSAQAATISTLKTNVDQQLAKKEKELENKNKELEDKQEKLRKALEEKAEAIGKQIALQTKLDTKTELENEIDSLKKDLQKKDDEIAKFMRGKGDIESKYIDFITKEKTSYFEQIADLRQTINEKIVTIGELNNTIAMKDDKLERIQPRDVLIKSLQEEQEKNNELQLQINKNNQDLYDANKKIYELQTFLSRNNMQMDYTTVTNETPNEGYLRLTDFIEKHGGEKQIEQNYKESFIYYANKNKFKEMYQKFKDRYNILADYVKREFTHLCELYNVLATNYDTLCETIMKLNPENFTYNYDTDMDKRIDFPELTKYLQNAQVLQGTVKQNTDQLNNTSDTIQAYYTDVIYPAVDNLPDIGLLVQQTNEEREDGNKRTATVYSNQMTLLADRMCDIAINATKSVLHIAENDYVYESITDILEDHLKDDNSKIVQLFKIHQQCVSLNHSASTVYASTIKDATKLKTFVDKEMEKLKKKLDDNPKPRVLIRGTRR